LVMRGPRAISRQARPAQRGERAEESAERGCAEDCVHGERADQRWDAGGGRTVG
jgi:hypothetical protein